MEPDNLLDEIEAKSDAAVAPIQPVKRFKYALALWRRDARAIIRDGDRGRQLHPNGDKSFAAAILDGILNQIGQRSFQRSLIASHADIFHRGFKRQFIIGGDSQGSKVGSYLSPDRDDIDIRHPIDLLIDALKIQKLIGQGGQTRDVLKDSRLVRP